MGCPPGLAAGGQVMWGEVACCLLLLAGAWCVPGWAQTANDRSAAAAPRTETGHPLAVNLARMGAFACAERANQIAGFLDPGQAAQAIVHTPESHPNQRLLMSTLVIPAGSGHAIGGVALAPGQANGCGGSYRVLMYSDLPCKKAVEKNYPGITFGKVGQLDVEMAVLGRNMWIVAMPAGSGCVLEKQEIVP